MFCQELEFEPQVLRGDTVTNRTMRHVHGVPKFIYGHIWNKLSNDEAAKKIIVTTWNHGLPVDDHIKQWWCLNE